jgi:hypothetical protein
MKNSTLLLTVAARSSNTSSFGLREHVIVAKNGLVFRALLSAHTPEAPNWEAGAVRCLGLGWDLELTASRDEVGRRVRTALGRYGFECVTPLPDAPAKVVREIFSNR